MDYIKTRREAAGTEPEGSSEDGKDPKDLVGICLSGGGIRSSTFSLGVLQGLAKKKLLKYVDYMCTVSGGGYIGSCLSSIMARRFCAPRA